MHLIHVIVQLLSRTKYYFLYPNIVVHLLELIATTQKSLSGMDAREAAKHIDERIVFKMIKDETGENIGELPFVPEEPNEAGGLILLKNKETNEWHINELPATVNLKIFSVYGRSGTRHAFYPLSEIDVATILQLKVMKERIYTSESRLEFSERKARSIVYENLNDEAFEILSKNINITFYRCKNVQVNPLYSPVDGIKLVHCKNVNVNIQILQDEAGNDKLPVIGIYAFYCDSCQVTVPKDYQGTIFHEIHGCMDFHIVRSL